MPNLDLTVDGADELDDKLRLIKGGGGALLREKIVAMASRRMVVIADASKRCRRCSASIPCPSRSIRFGVAATCTADGEARRGRRVLAAKSSCGSVQDGQPFITDGGNCAGRLRLRRIDNPEALDQALKRVPGVVENGLFLGIAGTAIIAGPAGVDVLRRDDLLSA